jgi:glutathione synthase/RimK-type ligase-like ATP-grasp enzyme
MKPLTDITILTDSRYVAPGNTDPYVANILHEDMLVQKALEERGLKVNRINWDHSEADWSATRFILFRSTWDYFDRFAEFRRWLERVRHQTSLINPYSIISWNLDKHYLEDLRAKGTCIPPTLFIEKGDSRPLERIVEETGWEELILKPVVSGAARHTYRFTAAEAGKHEQVYRQLIREEGMIVQEFQHQVLTKGEVAFMLFGGRFTHAVLKRAREGDFRVQDDYGGSIELYSASGEEIAFAEKVVSLCRPQPLYARVDAIWDNQDQLAVSELELIEPELWFRLNPAASRIMAATIVSHINGSINTQ